MIVMNTDWVRVLQEIRWPTEIVVLDFETYYDADYSLTKLSTIEYLADPRFSVIGVAELTVNGNGPFIDIANHSHFWHDAGQHLKWLQTRHGIDLEKCVVVVKNGRFDLSILKREFGIRPKWIIDVEDLANNLYPGHKNRLANLCTRFGLQAKGDTKQFMGYNWTRHKIGMGPAGPVFSRPMSDELKRNEAAYACNDAEREFELLTILLPRITNLETELRLAQHTLGLFLDSHIRLDYVLAEQIIADMGAELHSLLDKVDCTITQIRSKNDFKALLQEALGDEPLPLKVGKKEPILALARTDPQRQQMLEHPKAAVRDLVAARVGARSWPTHIKRVRSMVAQAKANNGLLPIGLKYYGAHTGRWSGTEGINPHNLGARSEQDLVNKVRHLLIPPSNNYVFVISDASQIEARVTGWVAGDETMLAAFRENRPVYCEFAAAATGKPIRKVRPLDPAPIEKYLTFWRTFGKVAVLGCGYGMGWKHLKSFAKNVYKLDLPDKLAETAVNHYRTMFARVPKLWSKLEYAFIFVTKYPHETMKVGPLSLYNDCGRMTVIVLPNGRELYYHDAMVKLQRSKHGKLREAICWPHPIEPRTVWAWGGFLTENVVQAISRDILAEAVLATEEEGQARFGMTVAHHVHDEDISVVRREHAKEALQLQTDILRRRPAWASDCPLDAKGFIAERYGK